MGSLSVWHWLVVAVVVLLLFGRGKVSEFMGDAAKGIKAFKKGLQDDEVAANTPPPAQSDRVIDQAAQQKSATNDPHKVG